MRFKPPAIGWPALLLFCGLMQIGAQTPPATGGEPRNSGFSKGAFKVGGGVSGPKAIWAPDPEYPEEGRKSGNRGTCVLWLVVGPDGRPRDIKVLQILGTGLDEKAVEAV